MITPSKSIATMLVADGFGTLGVDLFYTTLPGQPDNAIAVIDTGGLAPVKEIPGLRKVTIQVLVRNKEYDAGFEMAQDIYYHLHERYSGISAENPIEGYELCVALQQPTPILKDENDRHIFTCNYLIHIQDQ